MGGGTTLAAVSGGRVPVLAGRRARGARGDELRVLRRHARHRLGEHVPDHRCSWCFGAVAVIGDRAGHGRLPQRRSRRCWPRRPRVPAPDARARLAARTSSATRSSRSRRSPSRTSRSSASPRERMAQFKKTVIFYPLCMLGDLAALRVPGRDGQPRDRRPGDQGQAGGAPDAGRPRARRLTGRGARRAARRRRPGDDVLLLLLNQLRAGLAGGPAGRGHHGRGDGQRLADPGALHHVHGGRVRPLRGQGALRRGGAGADRTGVRRSA